MGEPERAPSFCNEAGENVQPIGWGRTERLLLNCRGKKQPANGLVVGDLPVDGVNQEKTSSPWAETGKNVHLKSRRWKERPANDVRRKERPASICRGPTVRTCVAVLILQEQRSRRGNACERYRSYDPCGGR